MVLNEPSIRPLRMTPPAKPYSVIVPGAHLMAAFVGQRDAHLRLIEAAYPDVNVAMRQLGDALGISDKTAGQHRDAAIALGALGTSGYGKSRRVRLTESGRREIGVIDAEEKTPPLRRGDQPTTDSSRAGGSTRAGAGALAGADRVACADSVGAR